ncbi:MAG TPA: glycosyltransferase family 2 protein [Candidatus Hydrogenedentes bacterium]|nr:glycosyltransferase family 2 protein [Candidatus Hydrogenedentota bacterium]HNT87989.1 glycosyltransferase family 2 protein [Candidatus Hydrogenedentota bacterium]
MQLSLVIPAYNEEARIAATLEHVLAYLDAREYVSEVVIVNDGSADATGDVVRRYVGHAPTVVRYIEHPENRGKGHAVRAGMLEYARGAYRVFFDADGSTPIEEVDKLWPCFESGADIVIGSRSIPGADVEVRQSRARESMGKVFNALLRLFRLTRFRDTQCGFKGFTARACETVFPRQTVMRFSFDAELLYIAEKRGLRIAEVPVRWLNSPLSRVHPITDATRMFWDMVLIRLRALTGAYR